MKINMHSTFRSFVFALSLHAAVEHGADAGMAGPMSHARPPAARAQHPPPPAAAFNLETFELFFRSTGHWDYGPIFGPSTWKNPYPDCGKSKQSPINIETDQTVCGNDIQTPLRLDQWNKMPEKMHLTNNGHSVTVKVDGHYMLEDGGLGGTFKVEQFHFHWGSSDNRGSEHIVNGIAFPMEMHIVTYNTKYGSFSEAVNKPDGLAVLAMFYHLEDNCNPNLQNVISYFPAVLAKGDETDIKPFPLGNLVPRDNLDTLSEFFRYKGSLTTPPCYESVQWIISKRLNYICPGQLNAFRSLLGDNHALSNNFRPTQPLNGRIVILSKCV